MLMCTRCMIASELYIVMFICAEMIRGTSLEQAAVLYVPRLTIMLKFTYVSTKCSKLETALSCLGCIYGNYYHLTGWNFQKNSASYTAMFPVSEVTHHMLYSLTYQERTMRKSV